MKIMKIGYDNNNNNNNNDDNNNNNYNNNNNNNNNNTCNDNKFQTISCPLNIGRIWIAID